MTPTLDVALLCSSRAVSDLGGTSDWYKCCELSLLVNLKEGVAVQLPQVWGNSLYEKLWNHLDKRGKLDFGSTNCFFVSDFFCPAFLYWLLHTRFIQLNIYGRRIILQYILNWKMWEVSTKFLLLDGVSKVNLFLKSKKCVYFCTIYFSIW